MCADLAKPQDVITELFDNDECVRKQFQNAVSAEAIQFGETFAHTFALFTYFEKLCQGGLQRAIVGGLMHGVLDDCLTSVKLLLSGKLAPSGNLARQATEGICMALMAAHDGDLDFNNGTQKARYWELVANDDERAEGNRAPHQVKANAASLGLTTTAAEQLKNNIALHHPASHAGRFAMAGRMDLTPGGNVYFGGHFDAAKLDAYRLELQDRVGVCKWAHEVMRELAPKVERLPLDPK